MPLLMVALISRLAKRASRQGGFYTFGGGMPPQPERERKKEGEVTVEVVERVERHVSESVGEYVEYDEADESK